MKRQDIKKLDKLLSEVVKARDNYTCQACGRRKDQGWQIHHHHIVGRNNYNTRWILENIVCVCFSCHNKFENDPEMTELWWKKHPKHKKLVYALKDAPRIKHDYLTEVARLKDKDGGK